MKKLTILIALIFLKSSATVQSVSEMITAHYQAAQEKALIGNGQFKVNEAPCSKNGVDFSPLEQEDNHIAVQTQIPLSLQEILWDPQVPLLAERAFARYSLITKIKSLMTIYRTRSLLDTDRYFLAEDIKANLRYKRIDDTTKCRVVFLNDDHNKPCLECITYIEFAKAMAMKQHIQESHKRANVAKSQSQQ